MNIKKNRQAEMSKDLELANRICQELLHNNNHAALELMEFLQEFWEKKILEEKVVCKYEGRDGASLKTFLFSVMKNHISQQFKVIIRRREDPIDDMPIKWELASSGEDNEDNLIKEIDTAEVPDDRDQEKLNREFVDMALEKLSLKRLKERTKGPGS